MSTYITSVEFSNVWGRISNKLELISLEDARIVNLHANPSMNSPRFNSPSGEPSIVKLDIAGVDTENLVSILYGQNGSGKTTSMRMIKAMSELVEELLGQYKKDLDNSTTISVFEKFIKQATFPENLVSPENPNLLIGRDMSENEIVSNLLSSASRKIKSFDIKLSGLHSNEGFDYKFNITLEKSNKSASDLLHPGIVLKENYGTRTDVYILHLNLEKLETIGSIDFDPEGLVTQFELPKEDVDTSNQFYSDTNVLPFIITDDKRVISLPPYYISEWFEKPELHDGYDDLDIENIMWSPVATEKYLQQIQYSVFDLDSSYNILGIGSEYEQFTTNRFPLIANNKFHPDLEEFYEFWTLDEVNPQLGEIMEVREYFLPFSQIITGISSEITDLSKLSIEITPLSPIGKSKYRINTASIARAILVPMTKLFQITFTDNGVIDLNIIRDVHLNNCLDGFGELMKDGRAMSPWAYDDDVNTSSPETRLLCKTLLNLTEFLVLTIYDEGFSRNKAKRDIFLEYGDSQLKFDKEQLDYSLDGEEHLSRYRLVDVIRSRLELIWSYLLPNYEIHRKNEFAREIIKRSTGITLGTNQTSRKEDLKSPLLSLDGSHLEFEDLSSGQKRIIQLITALLSEESKGPIMIDEPEISLHPKWLTELKDIITQCLNYSRRQLIICTHSPELVYLFDDAIPIEQFSNVEE